MASRTLVATPDPEQPTTAVEVHRTGSIAERIDTLGPLAEFGDLDTTTSTGTIPLLRLNRKVGNADSGFEVDGVYRTSIDVVIGAAGNTRAHFPAPFGKPGADRPDCWSSDGQRPDDTSAKKNPTCAGCPWAFEHTVGGDTPDGTPGCGLNLELLVYMQDANTDVNVRRIRLGGIAFKVGRRYLEQFRFSRPRRLPVQYLTRIDLEVEDTANGPFLVPKFHRVEQIPDEQAVAVATDARELLPTFRRLATDEIVEAQAHDVDDGDPFPATPSVPAGVAATGEILDNRPRPPAARFADEPTFADEPVF